MSRKSRVEKRKERQAQQRRYLMIGGGIALVVVVVVALLLLYGLNRDAQIAANATATLEARVAAGDALPTLIPMDELRQWDSPPAMSIDPEAYTYQATLVTEKGDIVVNLLAEESPVTVNNFVFLAREGFYDNTSFHRVIDGFMAQGGDPTGTGAGSPGYMFDNETDNGLTFDRAGIVAMANSGPDTNGSQFFITYDAVPTLNGQYTIFGEVVEGLDVAESLTRRDPTEDPVFLGDTLLTVEITETPIEG